MTTYQPNVSPSGEVIAEKGRAAPPAEDQALHRKSWASRLGPGNIGAIYVLVLEIIIFSAWAPSTFPHIATLKQVVDAYAITALAALAILVPLAARTFDLSFAAVMSLSGVAVARFIVKDHMSLAVAFVLALGVALIIGIINGIVVVGLRVDSFIGTLATGSIVGAFITFLTGDNPINSTKLAGTFTSMSQKVVGGVVLVVWWALILAVVLYLFMEFTSTGRRLYATGFNPDAAKLAGVRVDRLRFCSLLTSSLLAGFAGIMLASSLSSGSPTAGNSYLLPAFAASFVGATQFKRDRMNSPGTIVAVLMLGTGIVGLGLVSAPIWTPQMFTGVVLILALAASGLQQRSLLLGQSVKRILLRRGPVEA